MNEVSTSHEELKNLTATLREKLQNLSNKVKSFKEDTLESKVSYETNENVLKLTDFSLNLKNDKVYEDKTLIVIGSESLAYQVCELASRMGITQIVILQKHQETSLLSFLKQSFPNTLFESYLLSEYRGVFEKYQDSVIVNCCPDCEHIDISHDIYTFQNCRVLKTNMIQPSSVLDPTNASILIGIFLKVIFKTDIKSKLESINLYSETLQISTIFSQKIEEEEETKEVSGGNDASSLAVVGASQQGDAFSPRNGTSEDDVNSVHLLMKQEVDRIQAEQAAENETNNLSQNQQEQDTQEEGQTQEQETQEVSNDVNDGFDNEELTFSDSGVQEEQPLQVPQEPELQQFDDQLQESQQQLQNDNDQDVDDFFTGGSSTNQPNFQEEVKFQPQTSEKVDIHQEEGPGADLDELDESEFLDETSNWGDDDNEQVTGDINETPQKPSNDGLFTGDGVNEEQQFFDNNNDADFFNNEGNYQEQQEEQQPQDVESEEQPDPNQFFNNDAQFFDNNNGLTSGEPNQEQQFYDDQYQGQTGQEVTEMAGQGQQVQQNQGYPPPYAPETSEQQNMFNTQGQQQQQEQSQSQFEGEQGAETYYTDPANDLNLQQTQDQRMPGGGSGEQEQQQPQDNFMQQPSEGSYDIDL